MYAESLIFDEIPDRPSSHCAVICEVTGGDLLCVWYAGTAEKNSDVALMLSRWTGGQGTWTPPRTIFNTPGKSDGNAVIHYDAEKGKLWLFHTVIQERTWDSVNLYVSSSRDEGMTWTDPEVFDTERGMMVRNNLVVLKSGTWLLPAYDERDWTGFCYISPDRGVTWTRSGLMQGSGPVIQPTIAERRDGSLLALLRSGAPDHRIRQSTSEDGGRTWSECEPISLMNPDSGIDMTRLRHGELVLLLNNVEQGRTPLHLALSMDEGHSWDIVTELEDDAGEYSYPSIIQDSTGLIHCVYTYRRTHIKHVCFTEDWLATAG